MTCIDFFFKSTVHMKFYIYDFHKCLSENYCFGKTSHTKMDEFSEKFWRGGGGHFQSKNLCCRSRMLHQNCLYHSSRFYEILRITISHGCRFHEILHSNLNLSCLSISWDITPELQYLMCAYFMRYYTPFLISHSCKFNEISHQNCYISSIAIFMRYKTWTTISYGCRFHEIIHQNCNMSWL